MNIDYNSFRHFADSWALLALVLLFVGIVIWAFRPGGSKFYEEAADIPFRNEKPGEEPASQNKSQASKDQTNL